MKLTENDAPVDASTITGWKIAKKTKSIRAKPLINLLVDRSVMGKFLLTTLEGTQGLGDGSVVCVGEAGDIWQQMPKKLLAKYNVSGIDAEGWMICDPLPDNSVECFQWNDLIDTPSGEHYLKALWGEKGGQFNSCQKFKVGDYFCRNRDDQTDVWVVRQKFFENTYSIISK